MILNKDCQVNYTPSDLQYFIAFPLRDMSLPLFHFAGLTYKHYVLYFVFSDSGF
jgi:hypothetical protein